MQPGQSGKWGKLNVTEMLLHCNLSNKFILEGDAEYIKPGFKQRMIRSLVLYVLPRIPKNNPAPARTVTKGVQDIEFGQQKAVFIATIKKFPIRGRPFASIHPRMGYLSTKQWGKIAWMHMDHHLRQFGV